MTTKSPFHLEFPERDLLSWLFPADKSPSDKAVWIDAEKPANCLSPAQALLWIKRIGLGLQRLGIREGDVVLIVAENHLFVPIVYLGVAGHGRVFSGCNPAYGPHGRCCSYCNHSTY